MARLLQKMQHQGHCQQVGAASGGEIPLHKPAVPVLQGFPSREGVLCQGLCDGFGGGLLGLQPTPVDHVGVHRSGNQGHEGGAGGIIDGQALLESLLQLGKADITNLRKAAGSLAPDAGDPIAQEELLAHSSPQGRASGRQNPG